LIGGRQQFFTEVRVVGRISKRQAPFLDGFQVLAPGAQQFGPEFVDFGTLG